jgi:hypothetical protein
LVLNFKFLAATEIISDLERTFTGSLFFYVKNYLIFE